MMWVQGTGGNIAHAFNFSLTGSIMELYYKYKAMAQDGTLPRDFKEWQLAENNWTVGHEAARYSNLPASFDQWQLATQDGWTVAHEAARRGCLPADFDQWDLTDTYGTKVSDLAEAEELYMRWKIRIGLDDVNDVRQEQSIALL
jgi:hypothetical protein